MQPSERRDFGRRYGAAVALTGAAAVLMATCMHAFGLPAFAVFVGAVAASYAYGGFGPACAALGLSSVLSIYVFLPPHLSWTTLVSPWRLPLTYAAAMVVVALVRSHQLGREDH